MPTIKSINPYNGEINKEFELLSDEEINQKIEVANSAYLEWSKTSFEYRKEMFHKLADVIDADLEKYAKLQTIEMWMLYKNSVWGLKATANLIRWFADNAEKVLWEKKWAEQNMEGEYKYDSIGVIYWIWPWNFPYNQVLRAAVPNTLAGNTTVYKHASNVPMCAEQIENFFKKAGFPEWIYTNLFISASKSELIISNKNIRWVNLTGSEEAGAVIWALAWKYLKPSVLELGWNDPMLLLDHNNTKEMVAKIQACRLTDAGQRCNSSKRFIILEEHYDEFVEELKKYVENLKIWDPMDDATQVQPLPKKRSPEDIDAQVQRSIKDWAQLIIGWKIVWEKKNFYSPTVLADVKKWMTSYDEEIFWPVISIIKSKNIEESIKIANDSEYWLSAVVYWDNAEQCREVAMKLQWGMIFINDIAKSQAHLPFGWVKKSWYWKENWAEWLKAFTNKKVVIY